MRAFTRKESAAEWRELGDLAEVSISLSNGGQIDLLEVEEDKIRLTITGPPICLIIEPRL